MRFTVRPDDFIVEERPQVRLRSMGPFAIYRERSAATLPGNGPAHLTGDGFDAQLLGCAARPLSQATVVTNHLTLRRRGYATLILKVPAL